MFFFALLQMQLFCDEESHILYNIQHSAIP